MAAKEEPVGESMLDARQADARAGREERLWKGLLALREHARSADAETRAVSVRFGNDRLAVPGPVPQASPGETWATFASHQAVGLESASESTARFSLSERWSCRCDSVGVLHPGDVAFLSLYAPYALASWRATALGRSFAVSHFAQSLDGRIASVTGDSRWIGCPENLVHAHRMRALCDGVLVGAGTLRRDQPSLTVRHVEGDHPVRIVLGSAAAGIDSLVSAAPSPVLILGDGPKPLPAMAEVVPLRKEGGRVAPIEGLEELLRRGVHSVYIEGGSETTSSFLAAGCLDAVQVHLSPLIVGSGVSSFGAPPLESIEQIDQAQRFEEHRFVPVGEGMMFVGAPARQP